MSIKEEIQSLQQEYDREDDFGRKIELRDKIHNLKMKESGVKPFNSEIDCVGCGS